MCCSQDDILKYIKFYYLKDITAKSIKKKSILVMKLACACINKQYLHPIPEGAGNALEDIYFF